MNAPVTFPPMLGPTPPEARLAMPPQDLGAGPPAARFAPPAPRVRAARVTAFGGAAALTAGGVWQMAQVFDPAGGVGALHYVMLGLFAVAFGWIAFSSTSAVAGLLYGPSRPRDAGAGHLASRIAIVTPVYGEDAPTVFGALAAMGRGLIDLGHGDQFEIFVISDTRDADAWVRETTAFAAMRARLGDGMQAWYRRRRHNAGRKAGNLQDFVEHWGGRYDFMLVLDADSLMAPQTIVEMTRRMQADPRLGLLQSVPQLTGGETAFARLQQFAGAVYGPVVARGVSAWQGEDGNYWGHNAMIRTRAFAECAGLPVLEGRPPFGGHVLSHDFVEAALMRRAGWSVRMDPDLKGSFEGAPPSLLTAATRDRRWAQGNLQHLGVIGAAGLRWPNRAHFAIGIMSYLMSPIWLALLATGLSLTAQALLHRPDYFPEGLQLFPDWPRFDSVRMGWLFAGSMALLLLPKIMGVVETLASAERRRAHGGGGRIVLGVLLETLSSTLMAPVMMLLQTRHVAEILCGRDSGWSVQERSGAVLPWRSALRAHGLQCLIGLALTVALALLQPALLVWMAPVAAGLSLAPILSRLSGAPGFGRGLAQLGLFDIPATRTPPPIVRATRMETDAIALCVADGLAGLAASPAMLRAHLAAIGASAFTREGGADSIAAATAGAKLRLIPRLKPAAVLGSLTPDERIAIAQKHGLLALLARASSVNDETQMAILSQ